jgi:hypothetical protein
MSRFTKISIIVYAAVIAVAIALQSRPKENPVDKQVIAVADSCLLTNFRADSFQIVKLDRASLPYSDGLKKVHLEGLTDANGLPLHTYHGNIYYHPGQLAEFGLESIDVYHNTGDTNSLLSAIKTSEKLIGMSVTSDSAMLFPCTYNFSLHDIASETMISPWYSGMIQGNALSLFCRLFETTKDSTYLAYSADIFKSFSRTKGKGDNPWIACIDSSGFLWLEEYPLDVPSFALNGMIFAMYGVYDYYRISDNEQARHILCGALTTIKANISRYRVEGGVSRFCIKHDARSETHHWIHIAQLKKLSMITGDPYFLEMATKFEEDGKNLDKTHD